jgi:hypothetical protein
MRRLAFILLTLVGCRAATTAPPVPHLIVGMIDAGDGLDAALSGPAAGQVGEKLLFTVTTYGSSCYRQAGANVINQGLQMTIVPYDSVLPGICRESLVPLPRVVEIVFDRSGDAVLRLQGQTLTGRNPAVLTRTLQIRP